MTRYFLLICLLLTSLVSAAAAQGFGNVTRGGQGGRIIKVSNLNARGPGSLADALTAKGRRIVVFEVAGVIDLEGKNIRVREPHLTLAGQTAPSPGITLIKGGINISTNDVILQHIRVRPGSAGKNARAAGRLMASRLQPRHVWWLITVPSVGRLMKTCLLLVQGLKARMSAHGVSTPRMM